MSKEKEVCSTCNKLIDKDSMYAHKIACTISSSIKKDK